jgi:amino acid adenylation domain-containing protein
MSVSKQSSHLTDYIETSADKFPNRTAIVGPDGRSLTYLELNSLATVVASFLSSRGIGVGDRVGIILPKSIEAVAIIFGILQCRAAYVPADWTSPVERNYAILTDCNVKALFLDSRLVAPLKAAAGGGLLPELVVNVPDDGDEAIREECTSWQEVLEQDSLPSKATERTKDDLAYILYTSGSTGKPKGVMLTHANACAFVDWCSQAFQPVPEDRFSSHAPFHFDLSVLDLYVSLKHGASLHLIAPDVGQNPRQLAQFIAERRITVWYSAPSILAMMVQFGKLERQSLQRGENTQRAASSLRLVLFAGEVFPVKHLRHLTKLWQSPTYYNLYGPTETNVCTAAKIEIPIPEERSEPYPIGHLCSHCSAMVLDESGRLVNNGGEGLLYIAGPSVFVGYWKRPEENATRFIEQEGQRWYNTGDVVRFEQEAGYIYIGRRDRMVKRRGYRIELGEIEKALYQHTQLTEVAVIACFESDDVKILAYVASQTSEHPSLIQMKSFCSHMLPSYMIPDTFIFCDRLPRTSTDKIHYQALARSSKGGN